jgi:hypothetical protein
MNKAPHVIYLVIVIEPPRELERVLRQLGF